MLKVSNIGVRVFIEDIFKTLLRPCQGCSSNLQKIGKKFEAIIQEKLPLEYININIYYIFKNLGLIEPVKGSRETGKKKSFNVVNTLVRVAVGV